MRRLSLVLLLCATAAAQEPGIEGERHVSLETAASPETAWVGEAVTLRLRVGLDLEFFRKHAVPLYHRAMDIQAHVSAPWLDGLPGAEELPPEIIETRLDEEMKTFAVNDRVGGNRPMERRRADGIPQTIFALDMSVLFTSPGVRTLSAPTVRFAYATKFSEDFISDRRPLDRREVVVTGEPVTIRVLDLPEDGRPEGFTGAVGRFTVTAHADRREVEVGEIFRLVLRIDGEGNHGHFDPPVLSGLPGVHVYGRIDGRTSRPRTVTYDIAAVAGGADQVPAIPFVFFEPGSSGGYRTVWTEPIPLTVRHIAGEGPEEGGSAREGGTVTSWLIPAAILLAFLFAGALLVRRRQRSRSEPDPEEARALDASAECRRALEDPDRDASGAFSTYLAARLRCEPAAVIAPDLEARLVDAGIPAGLAARAAALMEALVAARYGADPAAEDRDETRTRIEELEAAFGDRA